MDDEDTVLRFLLGRHLGFRFLLPFLFLDDFPFLVEVVAHQVRELLLVLIGPPSLLLSRRKYLSNKLPIQDCSILFLLEIHIFHANIVIVMLNSIYFEI